MKKKVIFLSIVFILIISILLFNLDSAPTKKVYIDNIEEINKNGVAVYIEEDNGNYSKTTSFPNKESGYVLNTNKSVCDGSTRISWNNDKWGLELSNIDRENMKCYLYFRKKQASDIVLAGIEVKETEPDYTKAATTDEGVYKISDGMYGGDSYVWRGAVENNWVKFADMYWRIIRINGDGSMRLIYTGNSSFANVTVDENGVTATGTGTQISSSAYNSSSDRSEYVGYTYKSGYQRPSDTESGTEIASTIKGIVDAWYSTSIGNNTAYASKVADGKYCNDRDTASGYSWSSQPSSTFYYKGYDRIVNGIAPMLSCPEEDVYTLKVGLITIDEVSMAGGLWEKGNINYYLYTNEYYWTMTPYGFNGSDARVFRVYSGARLDDSNLRSADGVRPVINLRADTTFSSGNGTFNSPFVVS